MEFSTGPCGGSCRRNGRSRLISAARRHQFLVRRKRGKVNRRPHNRAVRFRRGRTPVMFGLQPRPVVVQLHRPAAAVFLAALITGKRRCAPSTMLAACGADVQTSAPVNQFRSVHRFLFEGNVLPSSTVMPGSFWYHRLPGRLPFRHRQMPAVR